jgi:hypothetical protein
MIEYASEFATVSLLLIERKKNHTCKLRDNESCFHRIYMSHWKDWMYMSWA